MDSATNPPFKTKPVKIYDRVYQVTDYPAPEDPEMESLALQSTALSMFFGMAEDDIGVPPYRFERSYNRISDDPMELADKIIADRKAICAKVVADAKAKGEPPKGEALNFSYAKLVGAYVHKVGLMTNRAIKARRKDHPFDKVTFSKETEPLLAEIRTYLHYVRLKGKKIDIDGVLFAHLGELFKAPLMSPGSINASNAQKTAHCMYYADLLFDWMKTEAHDNRKYFDAVSIEAMIETARTKVRERFNLRRQDEGRDLADIEALAALEALCDAFHTVAAQQHNKIRLDYLANNVDRARMTITEMFKQLHKPVSIGLILGIHEMDRVAHVLRKAVRSGLPERSSAPLLETLGEMHRKGRDHLRLVWTNGKRNEPVYKQYRDAMAEMQKRFAAFEKGVGPGNETLALLRTGMELLAYIPAQLQTTFEELPGPYAPVLEMRADILSRVTPYLETCRKQHAQNLARARAEERHAIG